MINNQNGRDTRPTGPGDGRHHRGVIPTNEKGQAMAEFVVFSLVLVIIFVAIMFFGKGYYLKQKCYTGARYCAWFTGRHKESEYDNAKNTQKNIAFHGEDANKLHFEGPSGFGDIPMGEWFNSADSSAMGIITSIFDVLNQAEKYSLWYTMDVPNVLAFMGSKRNPKSTYTVVADCWDWLDPDELVKKITDGVDDLDQAPVDVP